MKKPLCLAAPLAVFTFRCATGAGLIEVCELPPVPDAPAIPWVASGGQRWHAGAPLFDLKEKGVSITARGWAATTNEELLLRIEVDDSAHVNDQTGAAIWNGDFLRVSIDGWGDGSRNDPPDTDNVYGPDDVSAGFALSSKAGSAGWVYTSRNPALKPGAYPPELLHFTRDEKKKLTVYEVWIPWKFVAGAPGLVPRFGLAVQVRNTSPGALGQCEHLRWGGSEAQFLPGKFKALKAGPPLTDVAFVQPVETELWQESLPVTAFAASAAKGPRVLEVEASGTLRRIEIPGDPGRTMHCYRIDYRPERGSETEPVRVRIASNGGSPAAALAITPSLPGRTIEEVTRRIDDLLRVSPHPLFTRHLQSVKALVLSEWAHAQMTAENNPLPAAEVREFAARILEGLNGTAGRWESYWKDGMPLRLSFLSKTDNTLQGYTLTLPKGWDPAKSREEQEPFPLFVELHGSGHPNPLSGIATAVGSGTALDLKGYSGPKTFACEQRNGYHLMPHGRGNLGYLGPGETDVWEALDDFALAFQCDEDRQYLYGFSMGGGGTWRLAPRTPDRWAAVAICAPAIHWPAGTGCPSAAAAENMKTVPVWMWTGGDDTLLKDQEEIAAALKSFGIEPVTQSTPGVGHSYLHEVQEQAVNWLQQFTRKRPAHFSFVADTDLHRGAWGVEMIRDIAIDPLPRFECAVDGNTVRIESVGAPGLGVNLGEKGLGLSGEVKVIWNGKAAYEGPATGITLGKKAADPE